MKIIQITAAYKPAYIYGGPTMSVAKLCECLVSWELGALKIQKPENWKEKVDIHVFTSTANGKCELNVKANKKSIVDGVEVTYFKRLTKDHTHFSPALLLALRKEILRCTQNDKSLVVHIHAWWNLISVLSCAVALWYKIPIVLSPRGMLTSYTNHNRNSFIKNLIHRSVGKHLLKACHIHATSEKEKIDVLNIVNPKSISVIPNLVELGDQRPKAKDQNTSTNQFKLIFLSRIEEKKGLDLLFEALAKIEFNWLLTIAGSGEEKYVESLKTKTEKLKINHHINWLGQVNKEDKFELLAAHDLMVLSSHNENFANVVIESLSVGTPVLLSDQVGLVDYVLTRDLGWTTQLSIESISSSLNSAFLDLEKRKKIRDTAAQLISKDFNDQSLIKRYIYLYEEVVSNN